MKIIFSADYPEARSTLTERGCQLLRKDGLLDEAVFASKKLFPNFSKFKDNKSIFQIPRSSKTLSKME